MSCSAFAIFLVFSFIVNSEYGLILCDSYRLKGSKRIWSKIGEYIEISESAGSARLQLTERQPTKIDFSSNLRD